MKKNERQGNLEVLRIFSMILIIFHHYFVHGGYEGNNNIFLLIIAKNVGKIAADIFVLISGYFIFKSKFKIQKIIKIIFEFIFYSVLVNIIMAILIPQMNLTKYLVVSFFPTFFKLHWFVVAYIGMYLIIPFIKPMLNNLSQKEYLFILIILGFFISVVPTLIAIVLNVASTSQFGDVITFVYLAMIAGYISKFNVCILKNKWYNLFVVIYLFFVFVIFDKMNGANSFFVIIESILILSLFLKLDIKNNALISFFSNASLGVLLLHDNALFNKLMWVNIFKTPYYYNNPTMLLIKHIIFCIITIYLIGAIIDWLRRKIEIKIFDKYMNNKILNEINASFETDG